MSPTVRLMSIEINAWCGVVPRLVTWCIVTLHRMWAERMPTP